VYWTDGTNIYCADRVLDDPVHGDFYEVEVPSCSAQDPTSS
jgi:hypothetical protein